MRPTRLARNIRWLASAVLLTALGTNIAAQMRDSSTLVLDLTKPPTREEQGVSGAVGPRAPGSSISWIGGIGRIPRPYTLPLRVELQFVSPQRVTLADKFTVELILFNKGGSAYYLPASQKAATVREQGNKGRRTSLFSLVFEDPTGNVRFEDPPGNRQTAWVMASSDGSESIPDSFLRLDPGQSVRVVFIGELRRIRDRIPPELRQLRVRASVEEWSYEDKRYFIENESEPVLSTNTLLLEVGPVK